MRWNQGRDMVERLLAENRLQRVPPSRDQADRLISQARTHFLAVYEAVRAQLVPPMGQVLQPTGCAVSAMMPSTRQRTLPS